MVISYIVNRLSYRIMLRQQLQPWIGLPNILCGEFVVPELLQDAATPEALAEATLAWLAAPDKVQALQQRFTALHDELRRDTPTLCADAIQKVIAC
jgi:lipid-A-disaccharide synthase